MLLDSLFHSLVIVLHFTSLNINYMKIPCNFSTLKSDLFVQLYTTAAYLQVSLHATGETGVIMFACQA